MQYLSDLQVDPPQGGQNIGEGQITELLIGWDI